MPHSLPLGVYNNKGGVGKSTLTVGIAEFLASNRKKKVLIIDLDAQASSSSALLGGTPIAEAIQNRKTIADLIDEIARTRSILTSPSDFLEVRPASSARGTALGSISLLVPEKERMFDLEEHLDRVRDATLLRDCMKPGLTGFDYVLIDTPGNVDRRCKIVVAGLIMSDFVVIPIEPNQITLHALPATFDLIDYARQLSGDSHPSVLGMILNKADKRTEQYRRKLPPILQVVAKGELPPIFKSFLPDTPKLGSSTDPTRNSHTLIERFDTYCDNVREVACELEERCEGRIPTPPPSGRFGHIMRQVLDLFARSNQPLSRRHSAATTREG
jgi:chromosome partitioning protein